VSIKGQLECDPTARTFVQSGFGCTNWIAFAVLGSAFSDKAADDGGKPNRQRPVRPWLRLDKEVAT
jgi:hypothetical protein